MKFSIAETSARQNTNIYTFDYTVLYIYWLLYKLTARYLNTNNNRISII